VRCPRCGNENPAENRFCGMCGATLLAPASVTPKPQPVSVPPPPTPIRAEVVPSPSPEPPRAPAATEESPSISGPSFLGLNNPPPRSPVSRSRASLSIDPSHAPSSRSLEYLLDDDEEPRSSGAWKYLLILIALGLAVGFGYLRWKNQGGLPWLNALGKKPAAATAELPGANSNNAPAASPASSTSTPSITPDTQPTSPAPQPAEGAAQPAANPNPAPASAPTNPPANTPAPGNTPAATQATDENSKPNDSGNAATNSDKGASAPAKDSSAAKTPSSDSGDNADEESSPAPAKPAPKPKPTVPAVDPVTEAQKYIYGRGVSQDCERGIRMLKPAANQGNPKAMVEMGALYSAGLCTPHDLPTAYRWFAMALRKQPDNANIQADLQKLWSEMTQPERQLAIKLSQ